MGKKNLSKETDLRKRMYEFADSHKEWPKKDIVKHFEDEFVPRSTAYLILRRKENNKPYKRKSRSSPPHCKMTKEKVKRPSLTTSLV
jgi:hypothetical protein